MPRSLSSILNLVRELRLPDPHGLTQAACARLDGEGAELAKLLTSTGERAVAVGLIETADLASLQSTLADWSSANLDSRLLVRAAVRFLSASLAQFNASLP